MTLQVNTSAALNLCEIWPRETKKEIRCLTVWITAWTRIFSRMLSKSPPTALTRTTQENALHFFFVVRKKCESLGASYMWKRNFTSIYTVMLTTSIFVGRNAYSCMRRFRRGGVGVALHLMSHCIQFQETTFNRAILCIYYIHREITSIVVNYIRYSITPTYLYIYRMLLFIMAARSSSKYTFKTTLAYSASY